MIRLSTRKVLEHVDSSAAGCSNLDEAKRLVHGALTVCLEETRTVHDGLKYIRKEYLPLFEEYGKSLQEEMKASHKLRKIERELEHKVYMAKLRKKNAALKAKAAAVGISLDTSQVD